MKKFVIYLLAILFALSFCSKKDKIDGEYFEEYGITVPYKDVSDSETYNLLEALLDHIEKILDILFMILSFFLILNLIFILPLQSTTNIFGMIKRRLLSLKEGIAHLF